jgi:N-acetylglucosamine malate deacetylase 1
MQPVDILAIAAHRDDIELTCGGTLIKAARQGYRTAILDFTQGETGTRGSALERAEEASRAAEILGVTARENLGFPDAMLVNTAESRAHIIRAIRRFAPRIVIAPPSRGNHPDHRIAAELVRDCCFLAGLGKLEPAIPPHRPRKVLHCMTYREDHEKPTFVVDISAEFEQKLAAIACYHSQFEGVIRAGEVQPNGEPLLDIIRHHSAHYGSLIRTRYGEPFHTTETMRVDDIGALEVATF